MHRLRTVLCVFLFAACAFASGATVREGYFQGMELQPIGDARPAMLVEEPAAVIIFTLDVENNAAVARFNEWYNRPGTKGASIYGVVVEPDKPFEVVSEVITQRGLQMPIFFTSSKLLGGERLRVVLLDRGKARIMPDASPATVEAAIKGETVQATPAAAQPTATPQVSVAPSPTPSATPATVVVTTTTETVTTEDEIPGSRQYVNGKFNFSVQFPRAWTYKVARNGDGAVAKPPPSSRMDMRVWSAPLEIGTPGAPESPREQAEQHMEFIGSQARSQVIAERRLQVNDGNLEGRDYVYRYVKTNENGERQTYRGRIQVFLVNGTFKIASVEAPAQEFDANRDLIEDFIMSFHPVLRDDEVNAPAVPPAIVPAPAVVPAPVGAVPVL